MCLLYTFPPLFLPPPSPHAPTSQPREEIAGCQKKTFLKKPIQSDLTYLFLSRVAQLCHFCRAFYKLRSHSAHTFNPPRYKKEKNLQTHVHVYRPVTVDLWFLFNNVFMQLICLLPFFCLFSPYKCLISRDGAYCWCLSFDRHAHGRANSTTVTYFARLVFTFLFLFCFRVRSRLAVTLLPPVHACL